MIHGTFSEHAVELQRDSRAPERQQLYMCFLHHKASSNPYLYTFNIYNKQIRETLSFDLSLFCSGAVLWVTSFLY